MPASTPTLANHPPRLPASEKRRRGAAQECLCVPPAGAKNPLPRSLSRPRGRDLHWAEERWRSLMYPFPFTYGVIIPVEEGCMSAVSEEISVRKMMATVMMRATPVWIVSTVDFSFSSVSFW